MHSYTVVRECTREVETVKHLTIRNIPARVAKELEKEKRRRGQSINQTVIDLLSQGLGVGPGEVRRNGLARFAGTWSAEDLRRFEVATAPLEEVDEDLWR